VLVLENVLGGEPWLANFHLVEHDVGWQAQSDLTRNCVSAVCHVS
jgi:hypothetical protein